MRAVQYSGKADTAKLIQALTNFKAQQGPDFPGGDIAISPSDHQGSMTVYVMQISGQDNKILATYPPDKVTPIGDCKISA